MELVKFDVAAKTYLEVSGTVSMTSKEKIRVQTKIQDGEWVDVLTDTVPNNKSWETYLYIHINET